MMSSDAGQETPRPVQIAIRSERPARRPVEVFHEVQKAIDAANTGGAISVWRDRAIKDPANLLYNGSQPAFLTFFDPDEASAFALKVDELRGAKDASEVERIEHELRKGDGVYSEGVPEAIYQDEKWLIDPGKLLSEEQERKYQVVVAGNPHIPVRMLRMGKAGLFASDDAEEIEDLTAHMKGCASCSEHLRLLHSEDPDVLRGKLLDKVLTAAARKPKVPTVVRSKRPLMLKPPPKGLGSGGLK